MEIKSYKSKPQNIKENFDNHKTLICTLFRILARISKKGFYFSYFFVTKALKIAEQKKGESTKID